MSLNSWVQSGEICIWKPEQKNRNLRGWHLWADYDGYSSLIQLIDLLVDSEKNSRRTVTLTKPNIGLPPPNRKKLYSNKATVTLLDSERLWQLDFKDRRLYFGLSARGISTFRSGILEAQDGRYDFSIGSNEGDSIWFW